MKHDTNAAEELCAAIDLLTVTTQHQAMALRDTIDEWAEALVNAIERQQAPRVLVLPSGMTLNLTRYTHSFSSKEYSPLRPGEHQEEPQPTLVIMFGSTSVTLHRPADIATAEQALGIVAVAHE